MDAKTLQALRPRDASADGIASSVERMEAVLIELRGERAAIQGNRKTVLLTGTNADLDKADARIRALGNDIERIEAAIESVRPDLAVARGRERIAQIEALAVEADRAMERWRDFWFNKYPELAKAIADGLDLQQSARNAVNAYRGAFSRARGDAEVQAVGGASERVFASLPVGYVNFNAHKAPEMMICLPSHEPGPPVAWPGGYHLTETRGGLAQAYVR